MGLLACMPQCVRKPRRAVTKGVCFGHGVLVSDQKQVAMCQSFNGAGEAGDSLCSAWPERPSHCASAFYAMTQIIESCQSERRLRDGRIAFEYSLANVIEALRSRVDRFMHLRAVSRVGGRTRGAAVQPPRVSPNWEAIFREHPKPQHQDQHILCRVCRYMEQV